MVLTEEYIRKITQEAIKELGSNSTFEDVKEVVNRAVIKSNISPSTNENEKTSGNVILTSFGMNHPGIVAGVTSALSNCNVDINDLSQKIMGEFYTMIIILDISNSSKTISELQTEMNKVAEELKIKIYLQHEDLFRHMHRV